MYLTNQQDCILTSLLPKYFQNCDDQVINLMLEIFAVSQIA